MISKFKSILFLFGLSSISQAALIAHYDFSDGDLLDDEEAGTSYTLTQIQDGATEVTLNGDNSANFPGFDSGTSNRAYLQATGPGAATAFTISFWWKTADFDVVGNTEFQGLFTNATASTAPNSFQFDSHNADMRLVGSGGLSITYAESNLSTDTWYHTVIRRTSGNVAQLYITQEGAGAVNLVGTDTGFTGDLSFFRLGSNRNTDRLFAFDMANVKIYNDDTESLAGLLAEGSGVVPEPSTILLTSIAALGFGFRRRRQVGGAM